MSIYTDLNIPVSTATVVVKALDLSDSTDFVPAAVLVKPVVPGYERFNTALYAFLIEHASKGRVMFDLGPRKDLQNCAPVVVALVNSGNCAFRVEKDVLELLRMDGVDVSDIKSVIWSHSHFDHIGDMSKFPPTTELVIGQGTEMDVYGPENPDAALLASDFSGRVVTEVNFDGATLVVGGFRAVDLFEDGSLYLLDVPGHMPGHMAALARVTPTTFVLLGGDTCHHAGQLRPTELLHKHFPCPGDLLLATRHTIATAHFPSPVSDGKFDLGARMEPLLSIAVDGMRLLYADPAATRESIRKLGAFDACEDVFVVLAHDRSIGDVLKKFPESVNGWKEEGCKGRGLWAFLDRDNEAWRFGEV